MGPKKIAIITPTFLPYRGGMCVVAEQDARQLAALGHEVDVYVPGQETGESGGYTIKSLHPWFSFGNAAFVPSAFSIGKNYDLVVLHYPFYGGAEPVALAKLVGQFRRLAIYYHMDTLGHGVVRAVSAVHAVTLRPFIMRAANRILVTSFDYARSSALKKRFLRQPALFRELPPAVDVERFTPGDKSAELLERYGLDAQRPIALFVGGLDRAHYFKGVHILIRALAAEGLADLQAVIVGGGELIKQFKTEAERMGVVNRVTFTGPVSDDELPTHYRLADVFAFPSTDRSEAFGVAALEAMASGVPVVASDLPGVRTIVRPDETGFLTKPGSVSAVAARLRDVLSDKHRAQELGLAGHQMALDEYSEQRRIEKWERIANELFVD